MDLFNFIFFLLGLFTIGFRIRKQTFQSGLYLTSLLAWISNCFGDRSRALPDITQFRYGQRTNRNKMILNVSSLVYKKKNLYKLLYLGVTLEWYYRGALKITRLDTARGTRPWTLVVNKPAERVLKFKI